MKVHLFKAKAAFPLSVLLVVIPLFTELGYAQGTKFPNRPITFICPLPAGATGDLADRLIAKAAEKFLGQPVIVVNKPGGGTTMGVAALAVSKPDGYTVGYTPPTAMVVAPFLEKIPYEPLKDFQQIIQFCETPFAVFVKADSPFKYFKDLIAFARQNPSKLSYGTQGVHGIVHLTMLQVAKKEGVRFTHLPFKGGPEIQAALLGGHIDFGVGDFNYSLFESRQIRLLALLGEKRESEYAEIPLFKDLGYDAPDVPPAWIYMNIAGPKGMPEEVVRRLEDAFTRAMKEPLFIKGLQEMRYPIVYRNSKEMAGHLADYYQFYRNLLKEMGLYK